MQPSSVRLIGVALTAGLLLGTTACGGDSKRGGQATGKTAVTATATVAATASPTSEPSGLGSGIVISTCPQISGNVNHITSYNPATGNIIGSTTFTYPAMLKRGDAYSIGSCNGYRGLPGATGYDYMGPTPYSKSFFAREQQDGSSVIGYVDTTGSFTFLTKSSDSDFSKITHHVTPSFHGPSGRVYFWEQSEPGTPDKLMSVSVDGTDLRPEPDVPGIKSSASQINYGDVLYMPRTDKPIAATPVLPRVFNAAGTKVAGGGLKSIRIGTELDPTKDLNGTRIPVNAPGMGDITDPVGFVGDSDDSLIFTDGSSLYRLDGTKVTTLVRNESDRKIQQPIASPRGDVAFMVDANPGRTVYVLAAGSTEPRRITTITNMAIVNLIGFN